MTFVGKILLSLYVVNLISNNYSYRNNENDNDYIII